MNNAAENYAERACELEAAALQVANPEISASYLELARGFREMANLASLARASSDEEVLRLAERIVGRPKRPPETHKRP